MFIYHFGPLQGGGVVLVPHRGQPNAPYRLLGACFFVSCAASGSERSLTACSFRRARFLPPWDPSRSPNPRKQRSRRERLYNRRLIQHRRLRVWSIQWADPKCLHWLCSRLLKSGRRPCPFHMHLQYP